MNICVFCAANDGLDERFVEAAATLGKGLALAGHSLVYGGGKVGLMGVLAKAVHAHGGKVIGVIPGALTKREIAYSQADELIVTSDMLNRKAIMMSRSEAFVALPGGVGTLDEILEVMTHAQLGFHSKPTTLIDVDGFFQDFHQLVLRLTAKKFLRTPPEALYKMVPSVSDYLSGLASLQPSSSGASQSPR